MTETPVLVWFRNDLRVADNPALHAAAKTGAPVVCLYILDETAPHARGAASRWWLHHSLTALAQALVKRGAALVLRRGDSRETLTAIVEECGVESVYWNRRYDAHGIETDKALKAHLEARGVGVHSFNGTLLREPWELKTGAGAPYRVFTPFWRSLRAAGPARQSLLASPSRIPGPGDTPASEPIDEWRLTPRRPDWATEIANIWNPGEVGAQRRLDAFLDDAVQHYEDGRDRPDHEYTSRLSPHLAFGEIGPLQIWRAVENKVASGSVNDAQADKFLSEIAWREFSYTLLYHNEELPNEPLRKEFASFPWRNDAHGLKAWQKGLTGYPIVDAGMRQLWRTGWMHNRVRMIAASFLIKDLLLPWQKGAAWFWDTLIDADVANNAASWQWVAGCGADAAPYFRVFNPVTQGERFDPQGDYVRKFVPELAELPAKYIHAPWKAPLEALESAGVNLGKNYPIPILDHGKARLRALAGYEDMKSRRP